MAEPTVDEGWTPVPGWEGLYLASRIGRIYSIRSKIIMKQTPDDAGYLRVKFSRHNKAVTLRVHQIIALTFHGPCPPGRQVRHWDGDNQHNAASNLLYGTRSEDTLDQVRLGTHHEARKACCPRCGGPYKVHQHGITKGKRYCPACGKASKQARYERNPALKEQELQRRDRDKKSAYNKAYAEQNRERLAANRRARRLRAD